METGDIIQMIATIFMVVAGLAHIQAKSAVPEPLRTITSALIGGTILSAMAILLLRLTDAGPVQWLFNAHIIFLGLYSVAMTVRLDILYKRDYQRKEPAE
jgi:hypothetical protein